MISPFRQNNPRRISLFLAFCTFPLFLAAIDASNRYLSPRNPERKIRRSTELIVLHTTEAPARSSLNKLSDRGEAHYCVTEEGRVYRIVDRDREAFHAGRSMWRGREDVDKFSIGIECVGYHNKSMGPVQVAAIRELVAELKSMYGIPDERVVCHSHVAYGAPNKWQKRRHRGRKRCGMLFAMPSMRKALGLKSRPAYDADTRAGRLSVGDEYLQKVLYGRIDTMPAGTLPPKKPAQKTSNNWFSRFIGTDKKPAPPRTIAELKARGYAVKGTVSKQQTAIKIAGKKWNHADTYYVIKGKVVQGNEVDATKLGAGVAIWMKK
jgi:N-acetylmuramoyl-L-alanine amidase